MTNVDVCSLADDRNGCIGCPGNALYDVFVASQFCPELPRVDGPNSHRLIVGAAGQQAAIGVDPHHPNPFCVSSECLDAISSNET